MSALTSFVAIVAMVLVAGCSVAPGADAPAEATDQQTSSSAHESATPVATSVGEEPITYPPDNMWRFLSSADTDSRQTADLTGATEFAEVVVVGRYVDVERGPGYGPDGGTIGWYAVALIEPDRVIKGEPRVKPDGFIRVPFMLVLGAEEYPEKEFEDLKRSIPADPALLFLYSWAAYWDRAGGGDPPAWLDGLNTEDQYKTITSVDGAFRIEDGRLAPMAYAEGWPTACRDLPVDDVTDRVSTVADGGTIASSC